MTILSTILGWWSGTRVPTVAQRQETFSSFRHLNDKVPISDVEGLENLLNGFVKSDDLQNMYPFVTTCDNSSLYIVSLTKDTMIKYIVLKSPEDRDILITIDGDFNETITVDANRSNVVTLGCYLDNDQDIKFTNLPVGTTITIY